MSETLPNTPVVRTPMTAADVVEYLTYEMSGLVARKNELKAALEQMVAKLPAITDDQQLAAVGENVVMVRDYLKTSETRRKEQKEPFDKAVKAVDGFFLSMAQELTKPRDILQNLSNAYAAEKIRKAEADARELARIAQAEADRIAKDEAAAKLFSDPAITETDPAQAARDAARADALARAEQAKKVAEAAPASKPGAAPVVGVYGSKTTTRRTWSWEIEDIEKVPLRYLMVNPDAIKDAARARDENKRPTAVIPGIKWVHTDTVVTQ